MTPILGYSELLLKRLGKKNESYEDINQIYEAGLRAKEIVEQLLPFYHRENDTTDYGPVSLDAVLTDAVKMVRVILPDQIVLRERLKKTEANVFGNATQLNQVLLNLCSNASQAMEQSGGTLTVASELVPADRMPPSVRLLPKRGFYVRITVADTGCGMSEKVMKRIFDPFFTTKESGKGTGLGLSVVRNIVSGHGGSIQVESTVGVGSVFTLFLPVMDRPAADRFEGGSSAESAAGTGKVGNVRSVLALGDEKKILTLLKKGFERNGWRVDALTDPQEAMRRLEEDPGAYDLLIVDDKMPKCRGTDFAERAKMLRCSLPVVLITGLPDEEVFLMKKKKILDEVVVKPFDFSDLLSRVGRLLP